MTATPTPTLPRLPSDTRSLPPYDPARLFDLLRQRLQLHSDKALAKALQIAPPLLARLRHRGLPVSGSLLLRIQDVSGIAVDELRRVLGDRRRRMRLAIGARTAG